MVKEKPNSTRCYDTDGFRRRAACVCVRCGSALEVLLVSSSRSRERWVVPGGGIEPNENPNQAAQREVLEEAGVRGHVQGFLGVFENPESRNRTTVFLFVVTEELDSWDDLKIGRERRWFSVEEARQNLNMHKPRQRRYLDYIEASRGLAALLPASPSSEPQLAPPTLQSGQSVLTSTQVPENQNGSS